MISSNQLLAWSNPFIELGNELEVELLSELKRTAEKLIEGEPVSDDAIRQSAEQATGEFVRKANEWTESSLSAAYLSGINSEDSELSSLGVDRNENNPIPASLFPQRAAIAGAASETARQVLSKYPEHIPAYAPYENTFKTIIDRSRYPFVNSTVQAHRTMAMESIRPAFVNADKATRIQLSQNILNDFAKRGIDTIIFPSNHRMSAHVFAEREARAYLGDVALQGQINRATERGYDLVRITQYAGASPMCEPHQGRVYSLSGNSDQYPPFSDALFSGSYTYGGGIRHDYCGHQANSYIPGVSERLGPLSNDPFEREILNEMGEAKGNRFIFKAEQQQRAIERKIREAKRLKSVALTDSDIQKAEQLIRERQAIQREWIEQNPFLRRRYAREQV